MLDSTLSDGNKPKRNKERQRERERKGGRKKGKRQAGVDRRKGIIKPLFIETLKLQHGGLSG